ncbi:MAG TPA: hypothetical protein VK171_04660 [Fimbriimonas sp.]|nr:hypothetical protein [Fimbriimonas sp.]
MVIVASYKKSKTVYLMAILYVAVMAGLGWNLYQNGTKRGLTYGDIALSAFLVIGLTCACIGFILFMLVSRIELTETEISYYNLFGSRSKTIPLESVDTIEWQQDPDIGETMTVRGNGTRIAFSSAISNYEELNKNIPRLAKKKVTKLKKKK